MTYYLFNLHNNLKKDVGVNTVDCLALGCKAKNNVSQTPAELAGVLLIYVYTIYMRFHCL